MDKKIGIMTIYGGSNYGNKLQNYALQHFLKEHGYNIETIRYTQKFPQKKYNLNGKMKLYYTKYVNSSILDNLWTIKRLLWKRIYSGKIKEKKAIREMAINKFENQHIALSSNVIKDEEELKAIGSLYNYVIAGSDQIWNPYWQGKFDRYFLTFMPREKRVAYAPSIGVSNIPEEQIGRYRRLLNGFDRLSCREKPGADLITGITGKECTTVVDPVFLLNKEEWMELAKPLEQEKYVLTYFLGNKSRNTMKLIKKYAQMHNLKLIDIYDEFTTKSIYADIESFLGLIAKAEMFFTDSFHGCAFAIIMETQFVICDRKALDKKEKMNVRLDGLLETLGINERMIEHNVFQNNDIDFSQIKDNLNLWIEKSKSYLLSCLT